VAAVREARAGQSERTWTVRELADEFGVTTRTLRWYETEGLVNPRRAGSTRVYTARDRARVRLVLRGRRFGMSLPECREIVDMYDGAACSERRQLEVLLARLDEIAAELRRKQADLRRTLREVDEVAGQCRSRLASLPEPTVGDSGDSTPRATRAHGPDR
jgi:DNA-binding transcriptional MerR regulator